MCTAHQVREGQGVEGRPQEDRDAAGEEGVRQVPAGLRIAGHDEAELRLRHVLQQLRLRLRALRVLLEVLVRAGHLRIMTPLDAKGENPLRRVHNIALISNICLA